MNAPPGKNNFDLIRLLAALQVFAGHAFLFHFFRENWVSAVIWFIPGVPVFFGMSGFLLWWSLERNSDLLSYFRNRFLRLYPALWATMILTTFLLLAFHTVSLRGLSNPSFLLYFFGRCTIIFSFVPSVIKGFAHGNPNGSLWTIGVELQFYFLLPLIYGLVRRRSLPVKNMILVLIGLLSWWVGRNDPQPPFNVAALNGYLQILVSESRILYYLFFFIIGALFYVNYPYLKKFLEGRGLDWLTFYVVICFLSFYYTDLSTVDRYAPDPFSLFRHLCLMGMVFSAAFSNTGLSERILKGNDYSYGIYLLHLLILNSFYQLHLFDGALNFVFSVLVTGVLAFISWQVIEKRALKFKKNTRMNKATHFFAKAIVKLGQKLTRTYEKIHLVYVKGELHHLGNDALLEYPFHMMNPQCISIGDHFTARSGVQLRAYTSFADTVYTPVLSIGNHVHLAADCIVNCTHRIEIGDYVAIGVGSKLMDHAHGLPGYEDLQTTVMKRMLTSKGGVTIRRNVMLGTGVVVLPGVEIGENCIIGSNSVVTRSIPANSIAAGIPARVIKTIRVPCAASDNSII